MGAGSIETKPKKILEEIRTLISAKEPLARALIGGQLFFLDKALHADIEKNHSPHIWVLRAHIGTLDKLKELFGQGDEHGTFEIVAAARNLFENIVWLKLFNLDVSYGLIFYEQLLQQQQQNLENLIIKLESEAALFDEFHVIDMRNVHTAFRPHEDRKELSDEDIRTATAAHKAMTDELDEKARRSFSLYFYPAQTNSYGFQSELLRDDEIPKLRKTLAEINSHLAVFKAQRATLLPKGPSAARWNWKDRAAEVGLLDQYNFLYSYTSKLLHSTALNIITEKSLTPSERVMMLDYIWITVEDAFREIDAFDYDGKVHIPLINLEGE